MREINTKTLIGDILVGDIDVAYSTYLGYDEIAHHSGVRDEDAFYALKGMDRQIKRLLDGNNYSPRDYQFVIQSDHGQTNGATFKQRYGQSLRTLSNPFFLKTLVSMQRCLQMKTILPKFTFHFRIRLKKLKTEARKMKKRNYQNPKSLFWHQEILQ